MTGHDGYVELDAKRFHYREYGEPSAPPLVFLHGVLVAAVTYDVLLSELAQTRHVYALDQRGHGESARVDDYSWTRFVDDLDAFWEALDIGNADLVGHSMGAHHAARFAGRFPDRVRSLVLVDGGFGPWTNPEANTYWATVAELAPPDGFATFDDYVDTVVKLFPRSDRSIVERGRPWFVQDDDGRWTWPHLGDLAVAAGELPTADEEHALRGAVTCPVTVVRCEHSELFVGDKFRAVADEYRNGRAVVHRDAGHNVMWENVPGLVSLVTDAIRLAPQGPYRTR